MPTNFNSQFLPLLGGGHFTAFGMGGTGFTVTQDVQSAVPEQLTPDDGVPRQDSAPFVNGAFGLLPPYDGYMGPHFSECGFGQGGFDPAPALSVPVMWAMRATPAIVLASFYLTFAPCTSAPFGIEIADDGGDPKTADAVKAAAIQDLLPIWERAFPPAMESLHFGNWLQEIVWGRRQDRGSVGATQAGAAGGGGFRVLPIDVRPILPMEAQLHQDQYLRFAGYQIGNQYRSSAYAFLAVNQPHLDPVRGYSRNQNALRDWWRSLQSEKNADRTERKASGIHMMLGVPTGTMKEIKADGTIENVDARTMAQRVADNASRANVFTVPRSMFSREDIKQNPELGKVPSVSVDQFDWGNIGEALTAHLKRLDRLDVNMVRAWAHGEREGMEAEHGSRADAVAHKSGGVLDCEGVRSMLALQWDDQVVSTWHRQNFPQWQGKLRTKPAPLSDPMQDFLQKMTLALIADPNTGPEMTDNLDRRGLLVRTQAPVVSEQDAEKNKAEREQAQNDKQNQQQMNGNGLNGKANGNGDALPPKVNGNRNRIKDKIALRMPRPSDN